MKIRSVKERNKRVVILKRKRVNIKDGSESTSDEGFGGDVEGVWMFVAEGGM